MAGTADLAQPVQVPLLDAAEVLVGVGDVLLSQARSFVPLGDEAVARGVAPELAFEAVFLEPFDGLTVDGDLDPVASIAAPATTPRRDWRRRRLRRGRSGADGKGRSCAASQAFCSAGSRMPISSAMIAMATNSSMRVKPRAERTLSSPDRKASLIVWEIPRDALTSRGIA